MSAVSVIVDQLRCFGLDVISLSLDDPAKSEHPSLAKDHWELIFKPLTDRCYQRTMWDKDLKILIRRAFHSLQEDVIRNEEIKLQANKESSP